MLNSGNKGLEVSSRRTRVGRWVNHIGFQAVEVISQLAAGEYFLVKR